MRRNSRIHFKAAACPFAAVFLSAVITFVSCLPAKAAPKVYSDGGIFDADYYAAAYPDVAAAVGTAEEDLYRHYKAFGAAEGRLPYDPAAEVYFLEGEPAGTVLPDPVYTDEEVTQKILSLRSTFPEGLSWKGGTHIYDNLRFPTCGAGCVSFAMQISDLVYGRDAKVARLAPEQVSDYRPGDILRIRKNTHSVVVISVDGNILTVCEGNYNGKVHWGRKITTASLSGDVTYVERRYVMDAAASTN